MLPSGSYTMGNVKCSWYNERKTQESALHKALENNVLPAEVPAQPSSSIIDAMALIHKIHGENLTFEQVTDKTFHHIY